MRNEQEEKERFNIQKVTESIEELLLYYIKRQNPLKLIDDINKIFNQKKNSELFEEEWKGIIYTIYEKEEAEEIEKTEESEETEEAAEAEEVGAEKAAEPEKETAAEEKAEAAEAEETEKTEESEETEEAAEEKLTGSRACSGRVTAFSFYIKSSRKEPSAGRVQQMKHSRYLLSNTGCL